MMTDELRASAAMLLKKAPCVVILPAGCGKTHLVAASAAVAAKDGKRLLLLTHTHAGVDALRRRLRSFDVPIGVAKVSTIDSWTHRLVTAFPTLSDYECSPDIVWGDVHDATARLFTNPHIRALLSESYDYVIVDEYQDCTIPQHTLVMAVAALIPTIILGDPLQAIYDFAGPLVDWGKDLSHLQLVAVSALPWRWYGRNEALGTYLTAIRQRLEAGGSIDLSSGPVTWMENTPANRRRVCWGKINASGSVVILEHFPQQCEAISRQLGGHFGLMEEVEGKVLLDFARVVDSADGLAIAAATLRFGFASHAKLPAALKGKATAMEGGAFPTYQPGASLGPVLRVLETLASAPSALALEQSFEALEGLGGTRFRKEAWDDMRRALRVWHEGAPSLTDGVRTVRDRRRVTGRGQIRRSVSRAVLVKGQEFDECVVLAAHSLNARELYVAMTRARSHLTVLSTSRIITPS